MPRSSVLVVAVVLLVVLAVAFAARRRGPTAQVLDVAQLSGAGRGVYVASVALVDRPATSAAVLAEVKRALPTVLRRVDACTVQFRIFPPATPTATADSLVADYGTARAQFAAADCGPAGGAAWTWEDHVFMPR